MTAMALRRVFLEDTLNISGYGFKSSILQVRLVEIVKDIIGNGEESMYLLQIGSSRLMIESDYSIFPCPFGCESPLLNHSHRAYSPRNLLSGKH